MSWKCGVVTGCLLGAVGVEFRRSYISSFMFQVVVQVGCWRLYRLLLVGPGTCI